MNIFILYTETGPKYKLVWNSSELKSFFGKLKNQKKKNKIKWKCLEVWKTYVLYWNYKIILK